ncbi:MAG: hypothetical protein K2G59_07810, partial [Muribaculaceae bacterium]|nr:hypothetical protein [Muribaculaceae bacterium]
VVAASMALAAMPGCITGIESSPSVTKSEIKRQKNTLPTPEQQLIGQVTHQPFRDWTAGKEFIVTDPKIALVLTPDEAASRLAPGHTIRFRGMTPQLTVMGDSVALLRFETSSGQLLDYRSEMSPAAIRAARTVFLPFSVERSMVQTADSLLRGRELYLLTSHRRSADGSADAEGRKFVPVRVDSVVAGDSAFPLKIVFTDRTDATYSTFIDADSPAHTSRAFHRLFSFSDPRRNYPKISDQAWNHITRSEVALEMSRTECRLALGNPDRIDRSLGSGNMGERWTYDDGTVLLFFDGLLSEYRR